MATLIGTAGGSEKTKKIRFEDFHISPVTAFVVELPDSLPLYFQPWHDLAAKTINLMRSGTLQDEVHKLPQLDSSKLTKYEDMRLGQLQLVIISMGYIYPNVNNPDEDVANSLPACIAVPLSDLSDRLGVETASSYFVFLSNWERADKTKPFSKDNIRIRYIMSGGQKFVSFFQIVVYSELLFAYALPALQGIIEGSTKKDTKTITMALRVLKDWFAELQEVIKEFHVALTPEVFFQQITHFTRGYPPEGITFEGVVNSPQRTGQSSAASQSQIFQIVDLLLGVEYDEEKQQYFQTLRQTWPQNFRDFYEILSNWPGNVRKMATSRQDPYLTAAYNDLVDQMRRFRSYHILVATKFMFSQMKKKREMTGDAKSDKSGPLFSLLKSIRDVFGEAKLVK